jgi:hypothetical protein
LWHYAEVPKARLIFFIDKDVGIGICSACAAVFIGGSTRIKRTLEKKFERHVCDKHTSEDFGQPVGIAGNVTKGQLANADIALEVPVVSAKIREGIRLTVKPEPIGRVQPVPGGRH